MADESNLTDEQVKELENKFYEMLDAADEQRAALQSKFFADLKEIYKEATDFVKEHKDNEQLDLSDAHIEFGRIYSYDPSYGWSSSTAC